ncbi:MAG: hypothetical protein WCL43_03805 [Chlorobium sp.]|nr:MAG: hypothetical protein FDX12_03965 [Chlorobium sp.]
MKPVQSALRFICISGLFFLGACCCNKSGVAVNHDLQRPTNVVSANGVDNNRLVSIQYKADGEAKLFTAGQNR